MQQESKGGSPPGHDSYKIFVLPQFLTNWYGEVLQERERRERELQERDAGGGSWRGEVLQERDAVPGAAGCAGPPTRCPVSVGS